MPSRILQDSIRSIEFPLRDNVGWRIDELPSCEASQVLIEVTHSGMSNGTERSFMVGGPYGGSKWPCQCGYQLVGIVRTVGESMDHRLIGKRVFCGHFGRHASHVVVNRLQCDDSDNLTVELPEDLCSEHACMLGVASVSLRDVKLCDLREGQRVLVIGAGLIGQFAAQAARSMGTEVTLASRSIHRLSVAQQCGISTTLEIPDNDSWQQLQGAGFDVCIETSGAEILQPLLGRGRGDPGVLRYGGRLFLSGGRHLVTYDCLAAQSQAIHILHATHFTRDDLIQMVGLMQQGVITVAPLISSVTPVSRMQEAYKQLLVAPGSMLGTIFDWHH